MSCGIVLDIARLWFFPALIAFAAASDLLTMTISNRISLLLCAGFAVISFSSGMAAGAIGQHVAAALIVLTASFACFAMGWIGGGDAKLASVAALWLGLPHLVYYLVYSSLFGGALTLLLLQFRRWPLPYAFKKQDWLLRLHIENADIPYGVALALGALLTYPETEWVKAVDLTRFAFH
jgi:prepilin peptidase CpaA